MSAPLGISVEEFDKIFYIPPLLSVSIILCLPVLLTLFIFTGIPLLEKLINSGLIPSCVFFLKFDFYILMALNFFDH